MSNVPQIELVLVEDTPDDAFLAIRALTKHGYGENLILLKDGGEAINFFFGSQGCAGRQPGRFPKLVLLDLKLPKVDGLDVLRRIKTDDRTKTIPVVILTSSDHMHDIKICHELGANSYIVKPIGATQFRKAIGDLGDYWLRLNRAPL